jgi:membrane protease YdiL (CAAX protease family)
MTALPKTAHMADDATVTASDLGHRQVWMPAMWVVAFAVAEGVAIGIGAPMGALAHGALLLTLVQVYLFGHEARSIAACLAVASLSRILVVAMPPGDGSLLLRIAGPGVPFTVAALLLLRLPDFDRRALGLWPSPGWRPQVLVALVGVPLSALMFLVERPLVFMPSGSPLALGLTGLALVVCAALPEELLFRGFLVPAARDVFGRAGPLVAGAIFTVAYAGTLAPLFLLVVALTGLFFGWWYERTGSVLGVIIAHAVVNVGVFLVWPGVIHE